VRVGNRPQANRSRDSGSPSMAELIIYGATEPDATVTIDGQPVTLRKDGTFAFHYIFPDGQYRLPVVAVSARGDDQRAVQLQFERQTATQGDVARSNSPRTSRHRVGALRFRRTRSVPQGYVALILHAHLPFVRHPEVRRNSSKRIGCTRRSPRPTSR